MTKGTDSFARVGDGSGGGGGGGGLGGLQRGRGGGGQSTGAISDSFSVDDYSKRWSAGFIDSCPGSPSPGCLAPCDVGSVQLAPTLLRCQL